MRAGAGGNHPEVPGSRNALFSTSETHAANSRQREPAASRPRRRDVGNLSVGQTAGRGSDLPDRRLNRRQKAGRWHKPHPREAPCPGEPRAGSSRGVSAVALCSEHHSRLRLSAPGTRTRSGNEKRPGQSERKYSCTVPRQGKHSPWVESAVGKRRFADTWGWWEKSVPMEFQPGSQETNESEQSWWR